MGVFERLNQVAAAAHRIQFGDQDRIVLFSDCHRGDNSWADDFAQNQNLMYYALQYYYEQGYTYIEVGDGDELFEISNFSVIRSAHSHIFNLLKQFYQDNRLYLLYGNHDISRRNPMVVRRDFHEKIENMYGRWDPLFPGITVHEGLFLDHQPSGASLFLVHGHQGDWFNDTLWPVGYLFTRFIWRNLQLIAVQNPNSPAESVHKRRRIERKLIHWAQENDQALVCGHTHRPRLPVPGSVPYFNTGSCVFPRSITGIEIADGWIKLVQWVVRPDFSRDNALRIVRRDMGEPQRLTAYFGKPETPVESEFLSLDENGW
ncbi:MAG: metallophosphoesterase family protein [Anaerolineales bacterium]|nr:metallophosphoesterase family protein [Anaerolineales bacterium]